MVRSIDVICADSVRLKDEHRYYMMKANCIAQELKLVEDELLEWTEYD